MKTRRVSLALFAAALMALFAAESCLGQSEGAKPAETPPPKYFHLDFVVKELESGKVVNSRAYSTTISSPGIQSVIRSGSKVPVETGTKSGVTYIDVGVNIDCISAKEVQNGLALNVTADVSTIASDTAPATASRPPIIRQNKWNGNVLVPLRKATTLFSSDDVTTKRQMQLELTATPIP